MNNLIKDRTYWQNTWNRFKNGNRDAFGEIYNEYIDILFAYGLKLSGNKDLVKDSIQDLFIDLYRYGNKLDTPEYLEYYLIKSLKRSIIKKIQIDNRMRSIAEDDNFIFDLTFNMENQIIQDETERNRLKLLQNVLNSLDSKKKELLYLKFNSDLNYHEIGTIVGIKADTVKKQVYRLLDNLRNNYGSEFLDLFLFCFKA